MADGKLSQAAQQALGLPPGFKQFSPFPMNGMNVQASPVAIPDNEFTYVENFVRLGDGNLRTIWDAGLPLYTAPLGLKIVYYSFFTLGTTYYCAVFLSDGTAYQINVITRALVQIGSSNTFYYASAPQNLPCAKQWGTQYLLICNRNTVNDYWAWDGTIIYQAGTAAPSGVILNSGGWAYTSAPGIGYYGGYGSGIVVTPIIQGGSITQLQITNPGSGYQPGDIVQLSFAGGGSDSTAAFFTQLSPVELAGCRISSPGSGYISATVAFSGGGGTGAAGTVTIQDGQVINIVITNPGSGYQTTPTVTISSASGSGATAVAVLFPSRVIGAIQITPGSGYITVPTVTLQGGGGSGATAIAKLSPTTLAYIEMSATGSGYTSAPTVSFVGGGGTGAAGTANLEGDRVVSVSITNAGTGYTDPIQVVFTGGGGAGAGGVVYYHETGVNSVVITSSGQFYTSAPTIVFAPGANHAASATVTLMPYGVSGSAMETFLSRAWLVNQASAPYSLLPPGGNWIVSAPGSFTDFATSDGGVAGLNTDAFLQTQYTNIHQSAGYLYFFGDGSVSSVSNVATGGNPATTTFNYQNVDPQAGATWRDTLQDFGRSSIIGNNTGVYGLYGGATAKISGKLDQLFANALYPPTAGALTPTSAISTIFNIKHYLMLLTIRDPDTLAVRNVMVMWNEKDWTVTTQTVALTSISTQKVGSDYNAFGSDGTSLYPLFTTPSASLSKRLDTKQYGGDRIYMQKELLATYLQAQDNSASNAGISATVSIVASGTALQNPEFESSPNNIYAGEEAIILQPSFKSPYPFWSLWGSGNNGIPFVTAQLRFSSTSPDFTLSNVVLGYRDVTALF